ncbi:MAG: YlxR family protein [Candidatus Dadabacteria bacterium]|nr:MAG: YlxR family protein [Candidatus Dadabacteria bacterium]
MAKRPMRMCIGCRRRADKNALMRLVCIDGEMMLDANFTLGGRGAYVHKKEGCIAQSMNAKKLEGALRLSRGTVKKGDLRDLHARIFEKIAVEIDRDGVATSMKDKRRRIKFL